MDGGESWVKIYVKGFQQQVIGNRVKLLRKLMVPACTLGLEPICKVEIDEGYITLTIGDRVVPGLAEVIQFLAEHERMK